MTRATFILLYCTNTEVWCALGCFIVIVSSCCKWEERPTLTFNTECGSEYWQEFVIADNG